MADGTCVLWWCEKPARAEGPCTAHLNYQRNRGRLPSAPHYFDVRQRLYSRIERDEESGCWLWTGSMHAHGYGQVRWNGTCVRAYRAFWELERGPIPAGFDIDHLCRVRACVNPDHLEPVPHVVNMRRSPLVVQATDTHCAQGHPWPDGQRQRSCEECGRIRARERARRKAREKRERQAAGLTEAS